MSLEAEAPCRGDELVFGTGFDCDGVLCPLVETVDESCDSFDGVCVGLPVSVVQDGKAGVCESLLDVFVVVQDRYAHSGYAGVEAVEVAEGVDEILARIVLRYDGVHSKDDVPWVETTVDEIGESIERGFVVRYAGFVDGSAVACDGGMENALVLVLQSKLLELGSCRVFGDENRAVVGVDDIAPAQVDARVAPFRDADFEVTHRGVPPSFFWLCRKAAEYVCLWQTFTASVFDTVPLCVMTSYNGVYNVDHCFWPF